MRMMRCNLVGDASLSEISCATHFGGEETDVPSTSKNSKLLVLHVKCFLGGAYIEIKEMYEKLREQWLLR